jgi:carbon storage regulator CsrA
MDESILIADSITIKVISIDKGVVKLGIDAPPHVRILRSELIRAVEDSNKEASATPDDSLLQQLMQKLKL